MIANGLTKALTNDGLEKARKQLGLADISAQIEERRRKEAHDDEALERLLELP